MPVLSLSNAIFGLFRFHGVVVAVVVAVVDADVACVVVDTGDDDVAVVVDADVAVHADGNKSLQLNFDA